MRTVWKYQLLPGMNHLSLPLHAVPLSVQMQGEALCLWALVYTEHPPVPRDIFVAGTGHEVPDRIDAFVGTVQMAADMGPLVWHVFILHRRS